MLIIKSIFIAFLFLSITGCRTFIYSSSKILTDVTSRIEVFDFPSGKVCIDNDKYSKNSDRCYDEEDTVEIIQDKNNYSFSFKVKKSFISRGVSDNKLRKEVKQATKFKYDDMETALVGGLLNLFTDDALSKKQRKSAIEKEKRLIENGLHSFFGDAYTHIDSDSSNTVDVFVELSILDDNTGVASLRFGSRASYRIYAYVDLFEYGYGGINLYIPTCFVKTKRYIDGCEVSNLAGMDKYVSASRSQQSGYGEPIFTLSIARFIPPPDIPRAQGIPIDL